MSGIAGFFSRKSWLSEGDLLRMIGSLSHRGPHGQGIFLEDAAGLGLSMRDITRSDVPKQPLHSSCGRYVMVYNGNVYNFRELAGEINKEAPYFTPDGASEAEVVLQAFVLWGKSFTSRLNGMFAIVIYDRQAHNLHVFRDRLGIKPLYYFYDGEHFAFASELKSLMAVIDIKEKLSLDRQAVALFLHLGYIPSPISIFSEIKKFPSGNLAKVTKDGLSMAPWWQASARVESSVIFDPGEALERFESLLESSVQYRLAHKESNGVMLSGGIDSSLITAMAQKISPDPLNTFTIGFPEDDYNETDFARAIAAHLGTKHHEFTITEQEALDWLPVFFNTYDEPFADSSGIPTLMIAHLASQQGSMILTGDGGDELFMGYGVYKWAERLGSNYPLFLRNAAAGLLEKGNLRSKRAAMLFRYPGMDHFKSHIFSQEQYFFSGIEVEALLLDVDDLPVMQETFPDLLRELRPAEQQALFDLHYYLPDDLLVKLDRATMAYALEARVPLLDNRIVEFALNLDYKLKVKSGHTKWLMRQMLSKFVPPGLFERPKKGFAIPLVKWLQGDLRFLVDEHLSEESLKRTGILNPEEVKKLLNAFYNQDRTYLYQRIWALIVLQRWLEHNPLKRFLI